MSKHGLDPEVIQFDNEKNHMVLTDDDGSTTPCVNWHQYSMRARIENPGAPDQAVVVHKDRLEGSFVACLIDGDVVISHALVHPIDSRKATKEHGRIVAGRRLLGEISGKTEIGSLYLLAEYVNETDGTSVRFFVMSPDVPRMIRINSVKFLPAIYRRLKKISG